MEQDEKIIDGKLVSQRILDNIKIKTAELSVKPGLALILVGNNPASEIYVNMKSKRCAELGFYSIIEKLHENESEEEVLQKIYNLNFDDRIHGILVQLPLPPHLNFINIIEAIDYKKDVDGVHPINAGRLIIGEKCFVPCTPAGILELFNSYNIETSGKNAVIIGRSNIVGKPIASLLIQKNKQANATVTICHGRTRNISEHTMKADIIIAAMGSANFVRSDMIKEGCTIIDVGTTRVEDSTKKSGYRLVGDVNFEECYPKVSKITPVPGGVGPMTIAMLMKNTYDSAIKAIYD
jgi:methylenetetrahydrofolate dehydrogenase (NADP+) / methenyltetrahydrofolate cyclohydrolase